MKYRIILLICCVAALVVDTTLAQTYPLQLSIKDQQDQPIEFANAILSPCECGGTSNEDGIITIDLQKGNYQLIVSSIGYQSDTSSFLFPNKKDITIILNQQGYQLENIVVKGQNNQQNVDRTIMGVQRLSALKIKTLPTSMGETDVLKSLTLLPGVGSAGEASNGLSIRGGSLDQNLVLLDYAPIFNPTHLFGLFSVFTPDAIGEVNIYKSNVPAKFGGRIASVIDIKNKNPNAESLTLTGGIGLVSSKLGIEAPIIKNKLDVLLMTRVGFNDFLFSTIDRLKNTKANFWDATFKVRFRPNSKNQISFTGFSSYDFYELDITSKINSIAAESNQYVYSTLNGTLNWLHTFSDEAFLRTTLVNSDYRPNILFPQLDSDNKIEFQSRINSKILQAEFSKKINEQWDGIVGTELGYLQLSPGSINPGGVESIEPRELSREQSLEASIYFHTDYNPSDKIAISAGLRYTHFMLLGTFEEAIYADEERNDLLSSQAFGKGDIVKTYGGLEPRLGLRWKISPQGSFKASYALTRQFLQNIYNSTTPIPTSRWKTADRYIQPQVGQTYSIGYFQNLNNNKFTTSIEGYFRHIENVLDYKAGADFFLQRFIERDVLQGKARNYGIEFNFEKPEGKWNGWANYTWSRSTRRYQAQQLRNRINNNQWFASDFDRPHVFNGTINCKANDFNTFSFSFTYQTGRPFTTANAIVTVNNIDVPVFLERNNSRLPDFHRLDISWRIHNITTKKEKRWKGDWILTVYNVYGRKNAFNRYYGGLADGRYGLIFGDNPLGAYQLSIFSSPVVSLSYSFIFK
ncbi:MAG: TonB-dependent receptor [Bacteroidota bacterium]